MKLVEHSGCVDMYQIFHDGLFPYLFDLLKATIIHELLPWKEYRSGNDGPTQLQYNMADFKPEIDNPYPRPAFLSFRKLDDRRLTYGYAAMRESGATMEAQARSMLSSMSAISVEFPGPPIKNEAGLTKQYIAFVDCQDRELINAVFMVGQRVSVKFAQPKEKMKISTKRPRLQTKMKLNPPAGVLS